MAWLPLLLLMALCTAAKFHMQVINMAKLTAMSDKIEKKKAMNALNQKLDLRYEEMRWKMANMSENLATFQTEQKQKEMAVKKTISDLRNIVEDSVKTADAQDEKVSMAIDDIARQVAELKQTGDLAVYCPRLSEVINGAHMVRTDGRGIGANAVYACQEDHMICGTSSTITCQVTKKWETATFSCERNRWTNLDIALYANISLAIPCGTFQFQHGSAVTVIATPHALNRFSFCFLDEADDVSMIFSVRFNYNGRNYIVINSFSSESSWGKEDIYNSNFPFEISKRFKAVIKLDKSGYQVCVNGNKCYHFCPRKTRVHIKKMSLHSHLTIHSVEFST